MGVCRAFSGVGVGGNVGILFIIFKFLTISVPSKIILQTTFFANEQNTISFKKLIVCVLFHCFRMLQVRENEISLRNSSGGPGYLRIQMEHY